MWFGSVRLPSELLSPTQPAEAFSPLRGSPPAISSTRPAPSSPIRPSQWYIPSATFAWGGFLTLELSSELLRPCPTAAISARNSLRCSSYALLRRAEWSCIRFYLSFSLLMASWKFVINERDLFEVLPPDAVSWMQRISHFCLICLWSFVGLGFLWSGGVSRLVSAWRILPVWKFLFTYSSASSDL